MYNVRNVVLTRAGSARNEHRSIGRSEEIDLLHDAYHRWANIKNVSLHMTRFMNQSDTLVLDPRCGLSAATVRRIVCCQSREISITHGSCRESRTTCVSSRRYLKEK